VSAVTALMHDDLDAGDIPAGVDRLVAALRERLGGALEAVLLYGSCRRRGETRDGLVDLVALVAGYRAAHPGAGAALANALLPPSVYYLELGDRTRCKYAVVSLADFERRCRGGLDAYFWARFTQPARLVHAAGAGAGARIAAARAAAARRFAMQAAGLLAPGPVKSAEFWAGALRASYRCELRPEPQSAARALVQADAGYWRALSAAVLPELPGVAPSPAGWHIDVSRRGRLAARCTWLCRRIWGRTLNVARLFKAAGTFTGGIDYLVWKLERHSGVRIEATDWMRRHPRLAAFGLAWRLWRASGTKPPGCCPRN